MFKGLSISVVIPTWNVAPRIAYTLRAIPSIVDEVIVVDALSKDGTAAVARANGARVFTEVRRGYGRAYKTGFNAAKGDILVSADSDGAYPLGALPDVLDHMLQRDLLFMSCSRFPLDDSRAMRPRNIFGNRVLSAFASLLWRENFDDLLTGMWAMRREAWVALDLISDSWNFSAEIKVRAREAFGPRFEEFHVRYAERMGEAKLTPWRVGVESVVWLGMMRLGVDRQAKALVRPTRRAGDTGVDLAPVSEDSEPKPPVQ